MARVQDRYLVLIRQWRWRVDVYVVLDFIVLIGGFFAQAPSR